MKNKTFDDLSGLPSAAAAQWKVCGASRANHRTSSVNENATTDNILMLSYEFPPLGGGGARVVNSLTQELAKLGQAIDLVTMGIKGQVNQENQGHLEISRVPCFRSSTSVCYAPEMIPYILLGLPRLLRKIRKSQYRINHTHFVFPDGILSWVLLKLTGLPYVITAHGSDVPGYNPDRFIVLHRILTPIWRAVTSGAACIICPSRHLQSLLLKSNPNARTVVIPNGIDTDRFQPAKERKESIVVVTRMVKRKGVQYLIEALAGWESHPEVNIVGDGPYLDTLKSLAESKRVRVNFLGFVDNKSLRFKKLLESSRYFVFTSAAENFPVVLLEAMAAGLAIVTTNDTGCAEVVGDTAMLVPPKDSAAIREALKVLIADPATTDSMMARTRERVTRHFNARMITERHMQIYKACGRKS